MAVLDVVASCLTLLKSVLLAVDLNAIYTEYALLFRNIEFARRLIVSWISILISSRQIRLNRFAPKFMQISRALHFKASCAIREGDKGK